MGSLSFREFIRWVPDEASEPTSTLVLTSPERRFVDIRVIRPAAATPSWPEKEERVSLDGLDWAIAGTSSSAPTEEECVSLGRWDHWIDSRTAKTEGLFDEGINYLQSDGTTLEKGSMVNPETGVDTEYEEMWRDEEPVAVNSAKSTVTVLELTGEDDVKGMVILLGQYCQGLLRRGDSITAERWQWTESGGWTRTITLGDGIVPCSEILDKTFLGCGDTVRAGSDLWKVVETSR